MSAPQNPPEMKKTLSLLGLTINAMALIAPGAFLWLTYQLQAAQVDPSGVSTAPDIWTGLFLALLLSFLASLYPALRAAKEEPIKAIRWE